MLNLLFGLPLLLGVALTITDVMLVLGLQRWGFGIVEAFVAALSDGPAPRAPENCWSSARSS